MMKHDRSCWPLVLSVSEGRPDLDDLRGYCTAWTEWLDRGQPFAMLRVLLDAEADNHPPGGAREGKTWFAAESDRYSTLVLAMAVVAPPEVVRKKNKIKGGVMRGVPIRAFEHAEEALDWLLPYLQAKFPNMGAAVLRACVLNTLSERALS